MRRHVHMTMDAGATRSAVALGGSRIGGGVPRTRVTKNRALVVMDIEFTVTT